jgi:hypothetical protein
MKSSPDPPEPERRQGAASRRAATYAAGLHSHRSAAA